MSKPTMKGLPKDFPDVNAGQYWSGPDNANPDGYMYDPTHTIFYIRDYMVDVKSWFNSNDRKIATSEDDPQ